MCKSHIIHTQLYANTPSRTYRQMYGVASSYVHVSLEDMVIYRTNTVAHN